ncbi:hypothetical protein [Methanobrevibacter sp.]|uniref:hypothetical protein n=1 Tax=Methanobrevibacter sp. TaxID=66852 RepID=UPI0025D8D8F1|nr:hypothetical protein [Methanobrevibacter sp.]MBQ2832251.1 hypothetical protein [Methanobrevibacter sp.]
MGKYPLTYEEYEKKVIELLLRDTTPDEKKQILIELDNLLEWDPNFIKSLYKSDCGYYDSREWNWDKIFNEPLLLSRPVDTIEKSL